MIGDKKHKQRRLLGEIIENDEKLGLYDNLDDLMEENYKNYEVYGDSGKYSTKEDENEIIMENILNENEKNEINEKKEDTNVKSTDVVVDATPISENVEARIPDLKWEEYMHPDFPWPKKSLWINNPKAVQYWINTKNGTPKELNRLRQEEEDTKTY